MEKESKEVGNPFVSDVPDASPFTNLGEGDGKPINSSSSDLTSRSSGSVTVYALLDSIADVYFTMEFFIVSSSSVRDETRVLAC